MKEYKKYKAYQYWSIQICFNINKNGYQNTSFINARNHLKIIFKIFLLGYKFKDLKISILSLIIILL